mmetsp:Transcript_21353/g.28618  ORF Transcript_21353/g.28618 Transcript_21353/m.28618 type:complete len:249 (+) Transcript_21353:457-1203(+)
MVHDVDFLRLLDRARSGSGGRRNHDDFLAAAMLKPRLHFVGLTRLILALNLIVLHFTVYRLRLLLHLGRLLRFFLRLSSDRLGILLLDDAILDNRGSLSSLLGRLVLFLHVGCRWFLHLDRLGLRLFQVLRLSRNSARLLKVFAFSRLFTLYWLFIGLLRLFLGLSCLLGTTFGGGGLWDHRLTTLVKAEFGSFFGFLGAQLGLLGGLSSGLGGFFRVLGLSSGILSSVLGRLESLGFFHLLHSLVQS